MFHSTNLHTCLSIPLTQHTKVFRPFLPYADGQTADPISKLINEGGCSTRHAHVFTQHRPTLTRMRRYYTITDLDLGGVGCRRTPHRPYTGTGLFTFINFYIWYNFCWVYEQCVGGALLYFIIKFFSFLSQNLSFVTNWMKNIVLLFYLLFYFLLT